jgi:hypothetical protein
MKNQNQQRTLLEQKLIEKAMKDETFRKQLLEHPRETVEQEAGVKLPDGLSFRVVEETADQVYLVLPMSLPEAAKEDLTETELQSVVGGTFGLFSDEWTYCEC